MEALCSKAGGIAYEEHMFPLFVVEQLDSWPEKEMRKRTYLGKNQLQMNVRQARKLCQNGWMKTALELFIDLISAKARLKLA
ncbi:nudix hydrolase 17, mitochondrial-like [Nicotiana tabacum]|uniref:Nudix hydrolase 17, mitochondrial-like n=1 Tax=Nicotiana tabacum TaxID=4097 RepID=A0AC58SI58_TOBAC